MSNVFVLNTKKQPVEPVHPGRARILLSSGKAAVFKRYPFTIILKTVGVTPTPPPLRLKIDPGSKTTGLAIINDTTGDVVFGAEVQHRGDMIKARLDARRAIRRSRRNRHTRYRKPRWSNRKRRDGWLPPSLESRIANITTWVARLQKVCPLVAISQELVKFDTQLMENPEICGVEYQQGTLAGYETREYLLEKWNRTCAYCGKNNVPLQIEHIHLRAKNGTSRISNLTLACEKCNRAKGTQDIKVFLAHKPEVLKRLHAQAKVPLKNAAVINVTRWVLYERLQTFGLPVECGTGGRTNYNRTTRNLAKTHWLDAACVGASTPDILLHVSQVVPLLIKATGHGSRQMCRMNKYGFSRTGAKQARKVKDFQTGDIVKAIVPSGKKAGTYTGRVAVRTTGSFNITTHQRTTQGIGYRYCHVIHHSDGYSYGKGMGGNSSLLKSTGFLCHNNII